MLRKALYGAPEEDQKIKARHYFPLATVHGIHKVNFMQIRGSDTVRHNLNSK